MKRDRLERSLVGPAGEHYVLFRLHQLGVMSSLAPRNAPDVDVLAFADSETLAAGIQVKTRTRGSDGGWHMSKKHEELFRDRLFYVFVDLEPEHPTSYVIPSAIVADVVKKAHVAWLAVPGKDGRAHRDHDMRRLIPEYGFEIPGYPRGWLEAYRERWEQIIRLQAQPTDGPARSEPELVRA